MNATAQPKRPVFSNFYGSKWRVAPKIIAEFPAHEVFVDLFCGGASILARKPRTRVEVVNDLNGRVVNVFRVIRDRKQREHLRCGLRFTPFSDAEYQAARERSPDPIEDARRMIVLGAMAHSGTSVTGGKKTGFKRSTTQNRLPQWVWTDAARVVAAWGKRLQGVVIEQGDWDSIMATWDRVPLPTLFYVDPPYVSQTRYRTCASAGYGHDFTDQDHVRLAEGLHQCRSAVVLSGYDSELYRDLYGDWKRVEFEATANCAGKRTEVLWIKEAQ